MPEPFASANILLVSENAETAGNVSAILEAQGLPPVLRAAGPYEAKGFLIETDMDIIIIDAPRGQDAGIQFAMELIRNRSMSFGVILLMDQDELERKRYQTERMGIVTLKKPLDAHLLIQTIHLLLGFQARIQKLQSQAEILQQKLEDDRLVSRAKILLMEKKQMREEEAHHFIERSAMDACVKKVKIAKDIIRKYSSKRAK